MPPVQNLRYPRVKGTKPALIMKHDYFVIKDTSVEREGDKVQIRLRNNMKKGLHLVDV